MEDLQSVGMPAAQARKFLSLSPTAQWPPPTDSPASSGADAASGGPAGIVRTVVAEEVEPVFGIAAPYVDEVTKQNKGGKTSVPEPSAPPATITAVAVGAGGVGEAKEGDDEKNAAGTMLRSSAPPVVRGLREVSKAKRSDKQRANTPPRGARPADKKVAKLLFLLDVTGSMGYAINDVKSRIKDIVNKAEQQVL